VESNTGDIVEVARNAENAWVLDQPVETSADQGSVETTAGQIATIRILDRVPNLADNVVGLDNPKYTFSIQFTGGVERSIKVGVPTPTGNGYYAKLDEGNTLIISNTGLDALIGLLSNPPYLPTETPSPATPDAGLSPAETTPTPLP
jgi:hypothetical protein